MQTINDFFPSVNILQLIKKKIVFFRLIQASKFRVYMVKKGAFIADTNILKQFCIQI